MRATGVGCRWYRVTPNLVMSPTFTTDPWRQLRTRESMLLGKDEKKFNQIFEIMQGIIGWITYKLVASLRIGYNILCFMNEMGLV